MKIEVDIKKRYFIVLLGAILLLTSVLVAYAYNSSPANPSVFGHSINEVDGITCTSGQAVTRTASGWSCVNVGGGSGGSLPNVTVVTRTISVSSTSCNGVPCTAVIDATWSHCALSNVNLGNDINNNAATYCTLGRNANNNWSLVVNSNAGELPSSGCNAICFKLAVS